METLLNMFKAKKQASGPQQSQSNNTDLHMSQMENPSGKSKKKDRHL